MPAAAANGAHNHAGVLKWLVRKTAITLPKIRYSNGATIGSASMKPQATKKPAIGWMPRALYVYRPPAEGRWRASWPMLIATIRHATSASTTASGVAPPAYVTAKMMEKATAAAGAMWVMDWKSTGARPMASF